jgi:phosphate:Na+ symporter
MGKHGEHVTEELLLAEAAAALRETETESGAAASLAFADWRAEGEALLARLDPDAIESDVDLGSFEVAYQRLKAALLEAGAQGRIGVAAMDAQLRGASALRRAVDQAAKARYLLAGTHKNQEAGDGQ